MVEGLRRGKTDVFLANNIAMSQRGSQTVSGAHNTDIGNNSGESVLKILRFYNVLLLYVYFIFKLVIYLFVISFGLLII